MGAEGAIATNALAGCPSSRGCWRGTGRPATCPRSPPRSHSCGTWAMSTRIRAGIRAGLWAGLRAGLRAGEGTGLRAGEGRGWEPAVVRFVAVHDVHRVDPEPLRDAQARCGPTKDDAQSREFKQGAQSSTSRRAVAYVQGVPTMLSAALPSPRSFAHGAPTPRSQSPTFHPFRLLSTLALVRSPRL